VEVLMRGGRVLSGRRPSFHPHVRLRDMVFVKNNYSPTAELLRQSFKLSEGEAAAMRPFFFVLSLRDDAKRPRIERG
jgi:hypothetical protein